MIGRYGVDDLGRFLNIVVIIIMLISIFTLPWLMYLAVALFVYEYFRMLSRNLQKRRAENTAYLRLRERFLGFVPGVRRRLKQCKIYHFYRCPECRQKLRIPKGKGRISITCPKCHASFVKKS